VSPDFDALARASLFFLGHQPGDEYEPIIYPAEPSERPHLAYYGTTRSGKTSAIEYALQQIADERAAGFCYVDPHGSSYWRMASYLRQHEITERVLFWDINDPDFIVTYDPFDHPNEAASYVAENVASAVLATLGRNKDRPDELAALKPITEDGLQALVELALPFSLAREVFDPAETAVKRAIVERTGRADLLSMAAELTNQRERKLEFAPPYRRIVNLFRDDRLRLTFTGPGVDFQRLMDERWIVLINTQNLHTSAEDALLFTRLLVRQFFMAAKRRDPQNPAPFFLAIDEASRYLTADTAQILSQTAKFGLYLLLGMQSIDQARLENEESYVAIRKNVGGEIVMRLDDYEEAKFFAERFFGPSLDFKTVKYWRTTALPRTVEHVLHGRSSPTAPTRTEARSIPSGPTHGRATSAGRTVSFDQHGNMVWVTSDGENRSTIRTPEVDVTGESYAPDTESEQEGFHTEYDYGGWTVRC
jgi:hypothetical protein